MKASFQRTFKHICALYIENRILIKILKYQKFVKQTRDKQDIRGKNLKILELKNKQQPTKYRHARRFSNAKVTM